ncbi:uncharacterized protein LOC109710913 [Ananas comosus]|uniref:Uncharacterized protein LOC109704961 n=1 Tax=Ananas comosus TaxID=4615 RepID=A0A6P5ED19_ANACO|nr:uncharacterized protein LOC109704961 [Ananas comosus]XP_020089312.1 uncharacterized protein LOC109710913 [Ananas comosus]
MAFSFILLILVLMATRRGRGSGRGRRGSSKRTRTTGEASGSDPDYQESSPEEAEEPIAQLDKGKGIAGESSRGGGSRTRETRSKRAAEVPPERRRMYMSKSCIAERYVNFTDLIHDVPDFGRLLQRVPIEPVGRVPARAPFCVELIREFYMNGRVLAEDEETGTYVFETFVRQQKIAVTPYTIGELLGMTVDTAGLPYTSGGFQSLSHWDTIVAAICRAGVQTNRAYVESKDLRPEYHLLSLVLSYNVQPTIGTKRIRWDRLLLLFLLGHPRQAHGLNINIPFLMWQRMIHVIQASARRDLLPFPLLITRILQDSGVDVSCEKYDYGLGPIDAVTWAKSVSTLKSFQQTKGSSRPAPSQAPPPRAEREGSSSSGGVITVESLHHEVRSMKKKLADLARKVEMGMKRMMEKMGCRHDDIFPTEPTTYTRSTSRHPLIPPSGDAPEAGGSGAGAGDDDDDDDEDTE